MIFKYSPPHQILSKYYRADIDGLRAIAIVAVVLFHTYPTIIKGGYIGVDIFFVISGFLISTIIFRSLEKDNFSFYDFYARRVRRIFPALTFLLLGVSILGSLTLTPSEFKELARQITYGSLFGENIYLIKHTNGYWDTATELKPLMHLWTLAVEEQYYIIYPIICWISWRFKKGILFFLYLLWITSFSLNIYQSHTNPTLSFFALHTRFWELCTGCILATIITHKENLINHYIIKLSKNNKDNELLIKNLISFTGLFLITVSIFAHTTDNTSRVLLTLLPVLGTSLIIFSKDSYLNQKILSYPPLVFIGLISYTWYLWHWPLLSIARNIYGGNLPNTIICTFLLIAGFLIATVSYFLIETPIRKRGISNSLIIGLTSCIVFCAVIGLVVKKNDGFPMRLGDTAVHAQKIANRFPHKNNFAIDKYKCPPNANYCWTKEQTEPEIALVGDSHAHHLAYGLNQLLDKPFLLIGHAGTPPVKNLTCLRHESNPIELPIMQKSLDIVLNNKNIKTVILSARWNLFTVHSEVPYQWRKYNEKHDRLEVLELLLSDILDELINHNKRVIIILDNPQISTPPQNCLKTRPFFNKIDSCIFPRSQHESVDGKTNSIIQSLSTKYPSVTIYDASKALCKNEECKISNNNDIYYYDESHLTEAGSLLVVKDFLQNVRL